MVTKKTVFACCIVARTNSKRLPKKSLKKVGGLTMMDHIIKRIKKVHRIDSIYIATSVHPDDAALCEIAEKNNIKCYRGSELSVIDRLLDISKDGQADYVIRVTGDNIFTDPILLEKLLEYVICKKPDYARVEGAPVGVTAEIIKSTALAECKSRIDASLSEYLMLYMYDPDNYETLVLDVSSWVPPLTTLTVDTFLDWERTKFIIDNVGYNSDVDLLDIVTLNFEAKIPHFLIPSEAKIKLPHSEVEIFEFFDMMRKKKNKSHHLFDLTKEDYFNARRRNYC